MMNSKQPVQGAFDRHHAVVIGASMAGLLAARVLSDHFEQVTIIERDRLTGDAESRKGVPQGRHVHAVLARGAFIMGECFPDLFLTLVQDGAIPVSMEGLRWNQLGVWMAPVPSPVKTLFQSRPFLELHVRDQLVTRDNVYIRDACEVSQLCAHNDRITGVILRYRAGEQREEELAADLVVDTSGRGSRAPQWLNSLGYGDIQESSVKIDVGYATRLYRCPAQLPAGWRVLVIYSQGMSVAAIEAQTLDRFLREQEMFAGKHAVVGFTRRFQQAIARDIKTPWLLSTGEDLRYPGTEGKRSLSILLFNRYMRRVIELAAFRQQHIETAPASEESAQFYNSW